MQRHAHKLTLMMIVPHHPFGVSFFTTVSVVVGGGEWYKARSCRGLVQFALPHFVQPLAETTLGLELATEAL